MSMDVTLRLSDAADDAMRRVVAEGLFDYNLSKTGRRDFRSLNIAVEDDRGRVVGGLCGRTVYDWLFVELLFVPEPLRGRGIGAGLMRQAETEAVSRGCHSAWLDTFSFQAREFYERLGYTTFGQLDDYPSGSSRYFMRKRLKQEMRLIPPTDDVNVVVR